jgi:hypothetical protein
MGEYYLTRSSDASADIPTVEATLHDTNLIHC